MKNQKMEYKVGELANFFGISKDAIRLYDSMGIIAAKKDVNNYRVYSREDLLCLDYVMRLREMQFSLEEIRILINESAIEKAEAMMQMQEKLLEDKIEELKNLKTMVNDYRKSFAQVIQKLDYIGIEDSPLMIYKDVDTSVIETMKEFRELSKTQISKFTFICVKEEFLDENFGNNIKDSQKRSEMVRYAISMIDDEHLSGKESFCKKKFNVLLPQKCVHGIVRNYTNINYGGFEKIRDYVIENELKVVADPIFRVVSFRNNKKESVDYYDVWVPID